MGVSELLEVFLQLEQLDDKLLRAAIVHGRKKLQALAVTGTTCTEIFDVITIDEDETTTLDSTGPTQTNNQPAEVDNAQPL